MLRREAARATRRWASSRLALSGKGRGGRGCRGHWRQRAGDLGFYLVGLACVLLVGCHCGLKRCCKVDRVSKLVQGRAVVAGWRERVRNSGLDIDAGGSCQLLVTLGVRTPDGGSIRPWWGAGAGDVASASWRGLQQVPAGVRATRSVCQPSYSGDANLRRRGCGNEPGSFGAALGRYRWMAC